MSKHTNVATKLPKKSTFKTLLTVVVLIVIVTRWPQESAVVVTHVVHGLQAFITALTAGGGA